MRRQRAKAAASVPTPEESELARDQAKALSLRKSIEDIEREKREAEEKAARLERERKEAEAREEEARRLAQLDSVTHLHCVFGERRGERHALPLSSAVEHYRKQCRHREPLQGDYFVCPFFEGCTQLFDNREGLLVLLRHIVSCRGPRPTKPLVCTFDLTHQTTSGGFEAHARDCELRVGGTDNVIVYVNRLVQCRLISPEEAMKALIEIEVALGASVARRADTELEKVKKAYAGAFAELYKSVFDDLLSDDVPARPPAATVNTPTSRAPVRNGAGGWGAKFSRPAAVVKEEFRDGAPVPAARRPRSRSPRRRSRSRSPERRRRRSRSRSPPRRRSRSPPRAHARSPPAGDVKPVKSEYVVREPPEQGSPVDWAREVLSFLPGLYMYFPACQEWDYEDDKLDVLVKWMMSCTNNAGHKQGLRTAGEMLLLLMWQVENAQPAITWDSVCLGWTYFNTLSSFILKAVLPLHSS